MINLSFRKYSFPFTCIEYQFAVSKDPSSLTENEIEVKDEIRDALPKMGSKFKMPSKGKFFLGYEFLEKLLYITNNPDMYAEGLSRNTAQNAVKSVFRNMKSYFEALKFWKKDSSSFTGKPELMDYHRKGGHCTATISNQEAALKDIDGVWYLKLPYRNNKSQWIPFGKVMSGARLKQVTITPDNSTYVVIPVMVFWDDWRGYWMVIIGLDTMDTESPYDDVLIMADSYDVTDHYQDGYYTYPFGRFFDMWREGPCTGNAVPYEQPFVVACPNGYY